jgi:methionyl-tRNA synthetase
MDFTDDRLVQRYNGDLANSLGNLLNRTLNMAQKYRGGKLVRHATPPGPSPEAHVAAYSQAMDEHRIHQALESAFAIAVGCNQYIDAERPFSLAKDPAQAARLDGILYHLAESLRIVAILISPVLPKASAGILAQLGVETPPRLQDVQWGGLPDGHQLGSPTPLFPRVEPTAQE